MFAPHFRIETTAETVFNLLSVIGSLMWSDAMMGGQIKMYLGMISKLISCKAAIPSSLSQSVESVKAKWSSKVVNEVAPGVRFEFYPSQQIVRCCNQILDQLK